MGTGGRMDGVVLLLVGLGVVAPAAAGAAESVDGSSRVGWQGSASASARAGAGLPRGGLVGVSVALDAIDVCRAKLNPDVDIGYDRVVARCPNLVRRLGESGVLAWLPRDWQRRGNDLSAGGLRELRGLLAGELGGSGDGLFRAPRVVGRAIDVEGVHAVLAGLARNDDGRGGWWGRTKAWLRDVFEGPESAGEDGWVARMVGQNGVSQAVIELVSYVALLVVALLAVVVVVNELRVGGVLGALRRRFAGGVVLPVAGEREGLSWDDVRRAVPVRRPGLVLELVVGRLVEDGRLRGARGLTVRELAGAARLGGEGDRERLVALAGISERVRFSGGEVSEGEIEAAVEKGRVLLEGLREGLTDGGARGDARGVRGGAV